LADFSLTLADIFLGWLIPPPLSDIFLGLADSSSTLADIFLGLADSSSTLADIFSVWLISPLLWLIFLQVG
jgi:hypothetical protein